MKSFFLIFMVFSLSSCAVASLTTTAVSTAIKVAEVPFKVIGGVSVSYTHLTLPTKRIV